MESHHLAWLSTRVHRTIDWLKEKLAEGFDVHHLDGNHSNNEPSNLVLIECSDHMRLHGGRICRLNGKGERGKSGPRRETLLKRLQELEAWALRAHIVSYKKKASGDGLLYASSIRAAEQVILSFSDIMPNRSYSLAKGASGRSFEEPSIWRRTSTSSAR
jgi:hypothetical protein